LDAPVLDLLVLFFGIGLPRHFNESAIDNQSALHGEAVCIKHFVETVEKFTLLSEVLDVFREQPNRFCIGNSIGKMGQTKKDPKGNAVADLLFDSFIGKIIDGFEHEDFEHQDDIEGGASTPGRGL